MGFLDDLKNPRFSEKYEYGFHDISGTKPVFIQFRNDEAELKIVTGFSSKKIILKPDDIVEVGLNQETYRSGGKAAAGAIIGGILTGGIGLIAGAALGGKRRKENHLHLVVKYNGADCEIGLTPSNNIPKIYSELKRLMSMQTKAPERLEESSPNAAETVPPTPNVDISSELEKLHGLMQKGILTQEEFDAQKKKLLS